MEAAMKLNPQEAECLRQILGSIEITAIPQECFLVAVSVYERLGQALAGEEWEAS
jgi:hypothetical protein